MQTFDSEPFYIAGGTLPLDAPSYVTRQADHELFTALADGQYCYVLNSRQMGKSSLMTRCARKLRETGIQVQLLDLQKYGSNLTAEQWYRGILEDLIVGLGLPAEARDRWRESREIGPLNRLLNIIRDFLLPALQISAASLSADHERDRDPTLRKPSRTPSLVIFIDEIDYILSLPFSGDELFAGIRDCYNRRSEDDRYQLITFCLLGVATPADLIRDPQTTPFNIGRRIVLRDFTPEEAAPLAEGLSDQLKLLDRVLYWTHGHPYLTQKLCRAVSDAIRPGVDNDSAGRPGAPRPSGALWRIGARALGGSSSPVDALVADLFLVARAEEQEDNLLFVRNRLLKGSTDPAAVLDTYRRVWRGSRVPDDEANPNAALLKLSGVVRVAQGRLEVRNRIYRSVFNLGWIEHNMPDAEARRQRAARRRGFLHAAAIGLPIILLLSILTVSSFYLLRRADQADKKWHAEAGAKTRALTKITAQNIDLESQKRKLEKETLEARTAQTQAAMFAVESESHAEDARGEKARAIGLRRLAEQRKKTVDQALIKEQGARSRAITANRRLETILYPHLVERAAKALEQGKPEEARRSLSLCGTARRGPEWYYLENLAQPRNRRQVDVYQPGAGSRPNKGVSLVACAPNGATVATYCNNQTASLWGLTSAHKTTDLEISGHDVYALAFFDGGRKLACGMDNQLAVCDAASGRKIASWTDLFPPKTSSEHKVLSLATSPDGHTLAYGLKSRDVGILDLTKADRSPIWLRFPPAESGDQSSDVSCIAFSPDGSLAVAGLGKSRGKSKQRICAWDVRSRKIVARCDVPASEIEQDLYVFAVRFSGDGKHIIAGLGSGDLCVWTLGGGAAEHLSPSDTIPAHPAGVNCLLISSDGDSLASCGADGAIKIWDASGLAGGAAPLLIDTLRGHDGPALCLAFTPDEQTLLSTGRDGTMRYWTREPLQTTVRIREKQMFLLAPSQGCDRYFTCGDNGYVSVRETETAREIYRFEKPGTEYARAALAPDGRTIAISYVMVDLKRCSLALYEVDTGRPLGEFKGSVEGFECLAFSPDGRFLASGARYPAAGNWPYRVRLWDVAARKEIGAFIAQPGALKGHGGWVECLAFSNDGKTLVSGGGEHNLRFWDVATRKERLRQIPEAHNEYLRCAAFSPDGRWLATGGGDGVAKLWRWRHGKIENPDKALVLRGHRTTVKSVAFSPDGKALVTAGEEGIIKFWSMLALESDYIQEAISLPVEPYGDHPVAGAFYAPSTGNGSGKIVIGLRGGQVLYWGGRTRTSRHDASISSTLGLRHYRP